MSCITNNLIVLPADCKNQFLSDFSKFRDDFRLYNLLVEHEDDRVVAYSFDCNGDNPWYMYSHIYGYFKVVIIDYLDESGIEIYECDETGKISSVEEYWEDAVDSYLPPEVIESLRDYFSE